MKNQFWIVFLSFIAIYCCVVDSINFESQRKIERYRQAASDYTKVRSYKHRNGTTVDSCYRRKPGRQKHKPLK
jgi:hypothetical protein